MEEENNKKPECSSSSKVSGLWGEIWKLAIPSVGKNFMWRACNNLLPTKKKLLHRKVVQESMCPICGMEEETVCHILWDCPSARDVWGARGSIFHKCSITGVDFSHLAEEIRVIYGVENFGRFVDLARRIWLHRNIVVHGGRFTHSDILAQHMRMEGEEYKQAQLIRSPNSHDAGSGVSNWDLALDKHYGRIGVGVVVRDSRGAIVVARSLTIYGFVEPLAGEIMAACVAVSFCSEMEGHVIIFEGDALQVVTAVNSEQRNWSRNGHLIDDIKMLLQSIPQ
ncbi:uncharacterized protein LOC132178249 [Corylus avellana]|uniref:uncharacterized protein LOC132178249 n=1 Tax=Corylus avellana TaxID=13451 RepID=UPI00286C26FF|nr:uncharacterized protein LOC132178249 [Corylus avellana]